LIKQKGNINKFKKEKPGPAELRASAKALWAEASFCLDFLNTFSSRKKYYR